MSSVRQILCCLFALVLAAAAHVRHRGACPRINTTVADFKPDKFVGVWYVTQHFDPDASCLRFNVTTCGAGCLRLQEHKQINLFSSIGVSNVYQSQARLQVTGSDLARMESTSTDNPRPATYAVLATDYESFAALFTCQNVSVGPLSLYHRRDVYLLSRHRNLTIAPEHQDQVAAALIVNQIEDELEPVTHSSCISASQAFLDLNTNRLVKGVADVANSITSTINSITATISGLFSRSN